MTVQHLPPTATPEDVAAVLARDAVAVVDHLVPREFMARAREELAPVARADAVRHRRLLRAPHQAHRRTGRALRGLPRAGDEPARRWAR